MNINGHIPQILLIGFGLLSVFIAFKIAHFVLKVVLHLIGLGSVRCGCGVVLF